MGIQKETSRKDLELFVLLDDDGVIWLFFWKSVWDVGAKVNGSFCGGIMPERHVLQDAAEKAKQEGDEGGAEFQSMLASEISEKIEEKLMSFPHAG